MHYGGGPACTEEMDMAQAKITTDHDQIRKWAEARGERPAAVRSAYSKRIPASFATAEARDHGENPRQPPSRQTVSPAE
jgi:hypothetical protein